MSMAAKKAKTLPKIIFGADHGGFGMKRELLKYVAGQGYETLDLGTNACGADGKAKRCDYPDIASSLGQAVLKHSGSLGVLVCGTGIGMSIAANKINGIRCALCHDHYTASMCRKHNNANVLALGERVIGIEGREGHNGYVSKDGLRRRSPQNPGGQNDGARIKDLIAMVPARTREKGGRCGANSCPHAFGPSYFF